MNYNAMVSRIKNGNTLPESVSEISLNGTRMKWHDLDTVTSTMDRAYELVRNGCRYWTVITARHQSTGRGTHGRSWSSHTGKGLWMSLIIPPPPEAENLSGLTVLAAKTLADTLKAFTGKTFSIKHPNDVIINNRKIAGILVESATDGDRVTSVILGMGVNFLQTHEDFMNEGLPDATSLFIESGSAPDRNSFLSVFLADFKTSYESGDYGYFMEGAGYHLSTGKPQVR